MQAISDVIVNNPNSSAAVTIGTSLSDPIMAIPAGTKKVALTMDKSATSSTELRFLQRMVGIYLVRRRLHKTRKISSSLITISSVEMLPTLQPI